ncbi:MAG TPA: kelch repeat-containing protein, partial [Candidatus Angelobacter sp.]
LATTNTAVVSSANPSVFGESVTFTATVVDLSAGSTAQPTGAVQFVVDGVNFGSPVTLTGASSNSSTATSQATTTLSIGGSPHTVTANYVNADGNFTNSSNSLSGGQVVNQANTTTAVASSQGTITLGDTVTFTATVTVNAPGSGTPTGLVAFFDGSTPIGSGALSAGQATFSTALLAVGSDSITAIYNGDANFNASPLSSPSTETVNLRGSTTSVGLNPTTVGAGQASTITVTVTDAGASTPPGTPDVFSPTGAPATGRTGFTSTLFADGLVLVAGGTGANGTTVLNSAEIYSVSGTTFSSTGNLNTARTGAVAVLLPNGKVLIAGGSSDGTANGALNSAELFDPTAGTFTPTSHNLTVARFGTTATVLNTGEVLLAGGTNSGGVVNSAELYDPAGDTFTATGNLNAARTGASATLLGTGKVLVAGGSSNGAANGALTSAELFDPSGAGSFTSVAGATPTLATGRWQPEAALLSSGKVLVAGGQSSGGPLTTADIYDPVADSFTASTHQMNEARANGSAVAMPNGMVVLPGGTTSQTVDLYDADSDKFNITGSLLHFDNGLVSTLLNNGQVLVVGINTDNAPTLVSDAELYNPSFNPLGTVGFGSSEPTDVFGAACVLTPSSSTASTCTSTVTPIQVATSPHTITGTYPADAVHSGSSNTASLTVIPTAPPTIAKAFSANNVAQNGKVNVSFTIVNPNAAATLTGISFTDALPAGLVVANPNNLASNCDGTFTAVPGSSAMSLTGGTVAPAGIPPAIGQCVITLDLLVTGTGTIINQTGPISANESGPGNPSNKAILNVVLPPTVNKSFGALTIPLNGTTSLTFNLANPNPGNTLVGVALSDTLPSGLVVATPNGLTGSCVALSTISAIAGGNSISLSSLNLAASGSCSFSVNVTGTGAGTKNNTTAPITATFDDGSGTFRVITGGTASASIAVVAPPSIAKAFVPAAIAPGGVSTLSFTITNPAANTVPENGVAFTDTLPANVVVATPNGATGNCNGGTLTAVAGSNSISLAGGTVAVGSSCVVSVNVTSSVIGSYNNTTGAVSSTNGGTGNTASATLTVANASLSITKTHVGNFPRNSTGNNYTITVSNANAGPTVGTVTVTDTLPNVNNTLVPTGLTGTGWTCNLGTLTCTRSDALAPGASYPPITLTVTVPQNIRANVTNSATVSGGGDPNSHTANDPTHIGPPISITLAINNVTVNVGGTQFVDFTVDSSPGEGTINFACSGLPFGATCSFNPPSTNQLSTTVTMGITTSAGTTAAVLPLDPGGTPPLYTALLPLLGLMGLAVGRRRGKARRLRFALLMASMAVLLVLIGCGGGGRPVLPTPAGTSTITVTATSATTGDSASATITLTVP